MYLAKAAIEAQMPGPPVGAVLSDLMNGPGLQARILTCSAARSRAQASTPQSPAPNAPGLFVAAVVESRQRMRMAL
jgi:hypothetical protein